MTENEHKGGEKAPLTTVEEAGARGGKARAARMTKEQRQESARNAADARWAPKATHDGTLSIMGRDIECAVLEDGRRVLSQQSFMAAIGRTGKPVRAEQSGPDGTSFTTPVFLAADNLIPFTGEDLRSPSRHIVYRTKSGKRAFGYEARLLPLVCDVYLAARKAGVLTEKQTHIADACEILVRALAQTGIVALVDEATGFQEVRDRKALQAILDRYLRHEFAAWAKRFPDEFYKEMFRLKGWTWKTLEPSKGPRCVAQYTKDIAYERLVPGVLEELERRNPVQGSGRRKAKHHQLFTEDIGHPALSQHIHAVTAIMRISHEWEGFMRHLDRAFPKRGHSIQLDFDDVAEFTPREGADPRSGDEPSGLPAE